MKTNTEKLTEINELIQRLEKDVPDEIEAFMKFAKLTEKTNVLDVKNKALINVALAISSQCKWCIALHVKDAVEAGAIKTEIIEAAMQAVLMHGGPALMYMIPVENAIEEFIQ